MSLLSINRSYKHTNVMEIDKNIDASDNPALWDKEYSSSSIIPSSNRTQPAHALVEVLDNYKINGKFALDVGCGNGRNSIFLEKYGFKVKSIDFSNVALNLTKDKIRISGKNDNIEVIKYNIKNKIDHRFKNLDLILDSYCACHIIDIDEKKSFLHSARNSLSEGGLYVKIHLSEEDEYYKSKNIYSDSHGFISLDKGNNIMKRHYSIESFNAIASEFFDLKYCKKISFKDDVQGSVFNRSVFFTILERKKTK